MRLLDYFLLEMKSGRAMTLVDHTEWFRRRGGIHGIRNYHNSIVNAATTKRCAGSMENIKKLSRKKIGDTGACEVQVLVLDGKRVNE